MAPYDRRAILALAAGAVGGLLIACGVGWLALRPADGPGGPSRPGGAPSAGFAAEEKGMLAYVLSGDPEATVLGWGPHLRLTEGHVQRMGNPLVVRPGDVVIRAIVRTRATNGAPRREDVLAFLRDGVVQLENMPVRGVHQVGEVPAFVLANRWGDDWPAHIEAEVRRLTGG